MSAATATHPKRPAYNRRATDRAPKLVKEVVRAFQPIMTRIVQQALEAPNADEPGTTKNGVKHPQPGTITARLWAAYDAKGTGKELTLSQAKEAAVHAGLNEKSAAIAFYSWRKYHGHQ